MVQSTKAGFAKVGANPFAERRRVKPHTCMCRAGFRRLAYCGVIGMEALTLLFLAAEDKEFPPAYLEILSSFHSERPGRGSQNSLDGSQPSGVSGVDAHRVALVRASAETGMWCFHVGQDRVIPLLCSDRCLLPGSIETCIDTYPVHPIGSHSAPLPNLSACTQFMCCQTWISPVQPGWK